MTASAAYGMVLCGSDELAHRYRGRIEKVKFGVPIDEAFAHDIPATLLVLLLKVNKEGPSKKDIWRAPGNQAQVRKLSHIMQHGRLVNISNISVYTSASVIKRFLAKLPGGIFGVENEGQLFDAAERRLEDEQQRNIFCRIVAGLPVPSQHLLVLLFGTFHVITDSAEAFGTRMTPDAIGISVAPSLFHTCIHDGQRAKMEDVMRFKLASQVISTIIQSFGYTSLFPRECYEFYARITGRTLRVDEHWNFNFQGYSTSQSASFHLPSRALSQPSIRFEQSPDAEESSELEQQQRPTTSKQAEEEAAAQRVSSSEFCEDEDVYGESLPELGRYAPRARQREQSRSLEESAIIEGWRQSVGAVERRLAGGTREERLSTSMGEVGVVHSEEEDSEQFQLHSSGYLESTRSLTYLEWVHERQTKRMKTRSEWFLSPMPKKNGGATRSEELFSGKRAKGDIVRHHLRSIRQQQQFSPEHHLRLPKEEEGMVSSSGEEEMCVSSEAGCSGHTGCAPPSTDTSMKCSPHRPDSCCTSGSVGGGDAQMKSQSATETTTSEDGCTEEEAEEGDDDVFLPIGQCLSPTKTPRLPFQLLQERQYSTSTTDGSAASAQATPSAMGGTAELTPAVCGGGKNGRQRFFGSGEQEGGLQALPELAETSPQARRFSVPFSTEAETPPSAEGQSLIQQQALGGIGLQSVVHIAAAPCRPTRSRPVIASLSSGSSSGGSSGTSAQTVIGITRTAGEQQQQLGSGGRSGVVRRRSWRLHYSRPKNKSLEYETGNIHEEVALSSHSTPLRRSPPASIFSRRHSSNGGGGDADGQAQQQPAERRMFAMPLASSSGRESLVRRKSSNGGNGGRAAQQQSSKSKLPVQSRKSTQL